MTAGRAAYVAAGILRLKGLNENVIMGHLIPAGTGLPTYKKLKVTLPLGGEIPMDDAPRAAAPEASATAS